MSKCKRGQHLAQESLKKQKAKRWLLLALLSLGWLVSVTTLLFSTPLFSKTTEKSHQAEAKLTMINVAQIDSKPPRPRNTQQVRQLQNKSKKPKDSSLTQKADDTLADDPLVINGAKLLGGLLLSGFLYYIIRGSHKSKSSGQDSDPISSSSIRYIPPSKPLVLRHQGIDPATMEQSGLIKIKELSLSFKSKIGQKLNSMSKRNLKNKNNMFDGEGTQPKVLQDPFAKAISLFGPQNTAENSAISHEISAITNLSSDLGKSQNPKNMRANQGPKAEKPFFPMPVSEYFEPQSKEKLLWHRTYRQGSNAGMMAISNQRVLHVYRRKVMKFFPPGLELNIEKSQHPLLSLRIVRRRQARKNFLLIMSAPCVFWFPYGTLLSALFLVVYGLWTHEEIAIGVRADRLKSYPLPEATQTEFLAFLKKIRSRRVLSRKHPPTPHAG